MKPTSDKTHPFVLDRRDRSRKLHSGELDPATLEAHLSSLPDLQAQAEPIRVAQPALAGDIGSDDDDDDDGDED
jgi:hypothetical protein